MTRPGRFSVFRRLALALVAAQGLAYSVAPIVEGRTVQRSEVRLERTHTGCAVVHSVDNCLACQLMTARARSPLAAATILPLAGPVVAVSLPRTTHHAPRNPPAAGLHSRAPPTFV